MRQYVAPTTVTDALSITATHDSCIVFPDLYIAVRDWPTYREMFTERHGEWCVVLTKTAIVTRCNHHVMRLWVPVPHHLRDKGLPELPMDNTIQRHTDQFHYFSPYYNRRKLKEVVEAA